MRVLLLCVLLCASPSESVAKPSCAFRRLADLVGREPPTTRTCERPIIDERRAKKENRERGTDKGRGEETERQKENENERRDRQADKKRERGRRERGERGARHMHNTHTQTHTHKADCQTETEGARTAMPPRLRIP